MSSPLVSVIIPTYNGADFLVEAIQSVLNQTYANFELIVVNDVSPDHTDQVIKQFNDPRLKYIVHEKNQGAMAARKTALRASSGELIALLDQDDLFHPQKLETHVAYLEKNPDVGLTYNGRFEIEGSPDTIWGIWQPPSNVSLTDLILSFPFAPSDTIFRRHWALREDIWDSIVVEGEEIIFNGGEYVYCGRLSFAGCKFGSVERTLNYRRYHSGRFFKHLNRRCESELACQQVIFDDTRCPAEVLAVCDLAFSNTYIVWAYFAFAQGETGLGQTYLQKAFHLTPAIATGTPCQLVEFMTTNSIADQGRDHEALLRTFFAHLPPELALLADQCESAVARAYLLKGTNDIMWGRLEAGQVQMTRAAELGAEIDELYLQTLTYNLLGYEKAFGSQNAQKVIDSLAPFLEKVGNRNSVNWLRGSYSVNRAFKNFYAGEYARVPADVVRAVANEPKYLFNRGVLSILFRSMVSPKPQLGGWS